MRWHVRGRAAASARDGGTARRQQLPQALDEVFRRAGDQPVVVLAGAAASLAAPAGLPAVEGLWTAFASRLSLLAPGLGPPDQMAKTLRRAPFEQVLERIGETLVDRPSLVDELLTAVYRRGSPNAAHELLASLLVSGRLRLVLTTNFDTHIEDADTRIRALATESEIAGLLDELGGPGEPLRRPLAPTVVHLHGVVGGRLDATQRRVSRPLSGARRDLLRRLAEGALIAAVGYSGSDADILPSLAGARRPVVYVTRTPPGAARAFVEVDLNPGGTRFAGFDGDAADLLEGLRDTAALLRVAGVVELVRGRRVRAAGWFAASVRSRDTSAGRLGLSRALAAMGLFQAGAAVIGGDPEQGDPLWARVVDERAFLRRHAGRYSEAVEDSVRIRRALVARLGEDAGGSGGAPEAALAWDLERAAAHEVEARVLLASSRPWARGESEVACRAALADAARVLAEVPTVPAWDVDFMRGELGLLASDWRSAVRRYRAYERAGGHWLGGRRSPSPRSGSPPRMPPSECAAAPRRRGPAAGGPRWPRAPSCTRCNTPSGSRCSRAGPATSGGRAGRRPAGIGRSSGWWRWGCARAAASAGPSSPRRARCRPADG